MRTLHAYTSLEGSHALLRSGAELAADELTTEPDLQRDDDYRVRLAIAVPNRWPKRRPVPTARWVRAVDRRDGATLWDGGDLRVCSPPRGAVINTADRGPGHENGRGLSRQCRADEYATKRSRLTNTCCGCVLRRLYPNTRAPVRRNDIGAHTPILLMHRC